MHREVVGAEHTGPRCGWGGKGRGEKSDPGMGISIPSSPDADEEESEEDDSIPLLVILQTNAAI